MVGLTEIKTQIKEFAAFVKINKIKEGNDMKSVAISKHMVFMGSPGTAKTSVATQLAKILHDD
jgi:ATP-dependent Lon protease